jgi:hypothetical protein
LTERQAGFLRREFKNSPKSPSFGPLPAYLRLICSLAAHFLYLDSTFLYVMADMAGRKVFKVFNQDFIVDERYTVTKELGQGAYGIVW